MSQDNPTPAAAEKELKNILSEHWRDEGHHTSAYPVCPECRRKLQSLLDAARKAGAIEELEKLGSTYANWGWSNTHITDRIAQLSHPAPVHKSDKENLA